MKTLPTACVIIHRIIPCNHWLFIKQVKQSGKCENCGLEETILHLFKQCKYVITFWDRILEWWNRLEVPQRQKLSTVDIVFGIPMEVDYCITLNYIILLGKYYI